MSRQQEWVPSGAEDMTDNCDISEAISRILLSMSDMNASYKVVVRYRG